MRVTICVKPVVEKAKEEMTRVAGRVAMGARRACQGLGLCWVTLDLVNRLSSSLFPFKAQK